MRRVSGKGGASGSARVGVETMSWRRAEEWRLMRFCWVRVNDVELEVDL